MTKDDERFPPYDVLKEQRRALLSLHEHTLPDTRRCDLFRALIDFTDKDRIAFPGLRTLAAITRIGRPTVGKLLDEFAANGLIDYLDDAKRGAGRRIRVNPEKLAGYVASDAVPVKKAEAASHAVPLKANELAPHVMPVEEGEVAPGGNHFEESEVALSGAKSGTACSALTENKNTLLVRQGAAHDPDVSDPRAHGNGDVRRKADPPSNDAVKKKALADRVRPNTTKSARARRA